MERVPAYPKFLTEEVAKQAMEEIGLHHMSITSIPLKRMMCHVVILVPAMFTGGKYPEDYRIEPRLLYERSFAKEQWERDYTEIARCKALQLWHNRNDDRTDCMPHLLFPGDTPYWGGVKRQGIVVACSGVQPYFDKMISGMVADTCIALAYHHYAEWAKENEKKEIRLDFLPEPECED